MSDRAEFKDSLEFLNHQWEIIRDAIPEDERPLSKRSNWYWGPQDVIRSMVDALDYIDSEIGCVVRQHYTELGLNNTDIRRDTAIEFEERTKLIVLSSAPHTVEGLASRTDVISNILQAIRLGSTTVIEPFKTKLYIYGEQTYIPNIKDPIFAGFYGSSIHNSTVGIKQGSPDYWLPNDVINRPVLTIGIPQIFYPDSFSIEPKTVQLETS